MEIFLQKDKKILNRTKGRESVIHSTIATVEDNGNYTCKAEFLSVSKISTVNVVVGGKSFLFLTWATLQDKIPIVLQYSMTFLFLLWQSIVYEDLSQGWLNLGPRAISRI